MDEAMSIDIVSEMERLLEKMAVESFVPIIIEPATDSQLETALIHLKSMNAKYDKREAIAHVHALMNKYNIQLDELLA